MEQGNICAKVTRGPGLHSDKYSTIASHQAARINPPCHRNLQQQAEIFCLQHGHCKSIQSIFSLHLAQKYTNKSGRNIFLCLVVSHHQFCILHHLPPFYTSRPHDQLVKMRTFISQQFTKYCSHKTFHLYSATSSNVHAVT